MKGVCSVETENDRKYYQEKKKIFYKKQIKENNKMKKPKCQANISFYLTD